MKTDIEIARECKLSNIGEIAKYIQIPVEELEMYGKYIAKVPNRLIDELEQQVERCGQKSFRVLHLLRC